jgi:hypothetical protein
MHIVTPTAFVVDVTHAEADGWTLWTHPECWVGVDEAHPLPIEDETMRASFIELVAGVLLLLRVVALIEGAWPGQVRARLLDDHAHVVATVVGTGIVHVTPVRGGES